MAYIGYIYKITNKVNGKSYIGKTNNLIRRWNEHKWGKDNTAILNKALKKYGVDAFEFSIIEKREFKSIDEMNIILSQMEIDYIAQYGTFGKGYNATLGGDGTVGHFVSEETRNKFKVLTKKRFQIESERLKCGNGMRGNHHSEETITKIKNALLKRDHSIYEKMAEKRRGKHRDKEIIMKGAIKRRKPILQYDKSGYFLQEYEGVSFTKFKDNANIIACCKGKIKSAYGYIWKYKENDNYPMQIQPSQNMRNFNTPIIQVSQKGEILSCFDSISKAAGKTGISRTSINNCLYNRSKTAGGYIWKFKKEMEEAV